MLVDSYSLFVAEELEDVETANFDSFFFFRTIFSMLHMHISTCYALCIFSQVNLGIYVKYKSVELSVLMDGQLELMQHR